MLVCETAMVEKSHLLSREKANAVEYSLSTTQSSNSLGKSIQENI